VDIVKLKNGFEVINIVDDFKPISVGKSIKGYWLNLILNIVKLKN
jgi:hypothetical protein